MSYHSRCRGEITFTPALTWAEIKDSPFLKPKGYDDIRIRVVEREREIKNEHGVVITVVRVGTALTTPDGDEQSFRDIEAQMQAFAKEFNLAGGRARGRIVRSGEEQGDVQRYYFDADGQFHSDEAKLIWPDGATVQSSEYF